MNTNYYVELYPRELDRETLFAPYDIPVVPLGEQFKVKYDHVFEKDGEYYIEQVCRYFERIEGAHIVRIGRTIYSFGDLLTYYFAFPCVEIPKSEFIKESELPITHVRPR